MSIDVLLTNTNWWPSSAHLAISLARTGCRVAAAYPRRGHPLAKTKAVARSFAYRALSPLQSLSDAISASSPELVIPCDDRAVLHLHRLHAQALASGRSGRDLAELIERSLGSPSAFPTVSSRSKLLHLASSENIPVPVTSVINRPEDLSHWSAAQPFPWVMKTGGSWGGHGVKVVRSLNEAELSLQRMTKPLSTLAMLKRSLVNRDPFWIESWRHWIKPEVTVQSFITGSPANSTVFCLKGKILAGISVHVVAAQGSTGPATVVRIVDEPRMLHAAEAIASRLNLSGFHGFDFMIEEGTGVPYLVELNPRCTMPCHLRLPNGGDLIGALYSQLSGRQSSQPPLSLDTDLVAYFPQAWLADPQNEVLAASYHDVPWGEPGLVKELMLLPWPDRSLLAQISDRLQNMTFEKRLARTCVFPTAEVRTRT